MSQISQIKNDEHVLSAHLSSNFEETAVNPTATAGAEEENYAVIYPDGNSFVQRADIPRAEIRSTEAPSIARPAFTLRLHGPQHYEWLRNADLYSTATAFIRGDFDIEGDIMEAIRWKKSESPLGWRQSLLALKTEFATRKLESWFQSKRQAARNIRFHYDRSNEFYKAFLDSQMVYSCAYFKDENQSLEEAQNAKLDHICRKLDVQPGESFLDVGCGWGALVIRAAEKFGAIATGCTLSLQQDFLAARTVLEKHLETRVTIEERDYRALQGRYSKIASVGMFEHVGRKRLHEYFRKISELLDDNGLFLNHGIIRPEGVTDDPDTLFLQRRVFPGGELATLSTVVAEAGRAGFEVLDVENLRLHYALTCRCWVERLQQNAAECLKHVDRETYRTWLLYLAGSALSFRSGMTDLCQVLMAKRHTHGNRHRTRDYMYA